MRYPSSGSSTHKGDMGISPCFHYDLTPCGVAEGPLFFIMTERRYSERERV